MTITKPHLLTQEGLDKLTSELERLRTEGRERVADRLHRAFQDGQDDDFVENAELEAARHEQAFLEGRIQELEDILKNYKLIDDNNGDPHDSVRVGDWITVSEEGLDDEERYHLVGAAEADPANGRISNESPLGVALLGKKVGEIVRVNAPNGLLEFRVVKIG
ncbi:MAG: transcription elongation factor GreA [Anaerolineaceae bacterium]|jgi:transcription elongation factor GreA|nr:transcription elongation factor GreA [Anaerolineaceae bacterium]